MTQEASNAATNPLVEPCNAAIGIADAEYVLAWLRQTHAPRNIVELQERAIRILIATEIKRVVARSWDDATPDEIRDARIQSLEEGLEHLKLCVMEALRYGTVRPSSESGTPAADILDEEWSK